MKPPTWPLFSSTPPGKRWLKGKAAGIQSSLPTNDLSPDIELAAQDLNTDDYGLEPGNNL